MDYCPCCERPYDDLSEVAEVPIGDLVASWQYLRRGEQRVKIEPAQMRLMRLFARKPLCSYSLIKAELFPESESKIEQIYVCRLRKTLREIGSSVSIETLPGWGYHLHS